MKKVLFRRHDLLILSEEGRIAAYKEALIRNSDISDKLLYQIIVDEKRPAIVKRQSAHTDGYIEVGFSSRLLVNGNRLRVESLASLQFIEEIITPFQVAAKWMKALDDAAEQHKPGDDEGEQHKPRDDEGELHEPGGDASLLLNAVLQIAENTGVRVGIFGSYALEVVTGRPNTNASSDLDIIIEARRHEDILAFYNWMNTAHTFKMPTEHNKSGIAPQLTPDIKPIPATDIGPTTAAEIKPTVAAEFEPTIAASISPDAESVITPCNEPAEAAGIALDIELYIGGGYFVKLAEYLAERKTILAKGFRDVKLVNLTDVRYKFSHEFGESVAISAAKALLYEVAVTPKPGLVDLRNNGAHTDMDVLTFIDSTMTLLPHFRGFFAAGFNGKDSGGVFESLRYMGMVAEEEMLTATRGVNTHKGAVFTLGLLCAAAGRLYAAEGIYDTDKVLQICAETFGPALEKELEGIKRSNAIRSNAITSNAAASNAVTSNDVTSYDVTSIAVTFGEKLYVSRGIKGARGEAASGFRTVRNVGLPTLKKELEKGSSVNKAAVAALLHLIAASDDTNLIKRSGAESQNRIKAMVRNALDGKEEPEEPEEPEESEESEAHEAPEAPEAPKAPEESEESEAHEIHKSTGFTDRVSELDRYFIDNNISPGGSADLLAATLMLYFLEEKAK